MATHHIEFSIETQIVEWDIVVFKTVSFVNTYYPHRFYGPCMVGEVSLQVPTRDIGGDWVFSPVALSFGLETQGAPTSDLAISPLGGYSEPTDTAPGMQQFLAAASPPFWTPANSQNPATCIKVIPTFQAPGFTLTGPATPFFAGGAAISFEADFETDADGLIDDDFTITVGGQVFVMELTSPGARLPIVPRRARWDISGGAFPPGPNFGFARNFDPRTWGGQSGANPASWSHTDLTGDLLTIPQPVWEVNGAPVTWTWPEAETDFGIGELASVAGSSSSSPTTIPSGTYTTQIVDPFTQAVVESGGAARITKVGGNFTHLQLGWTGSFAVGQGHHSLGQGHHWNWRQPLATLNGGAGLGFAVSQGFYFFGGVGGADSSGTSGGVSRYPGEFSYQSTYLPPGGAESLDLLRHPLTDQLLLAFIDGGALKVVLYSDAEDGTVALIVTVDAGPECHRPKWQPLPDGSLRLLYQNDADLYLAESRDIGRTWPTVTTLPFTPDLATCEWITLLQGRVAPVVMLYTEATQKWEVSVGQLGTDNVTWTWSTPVDIGVTAAAVMGRLQQRKDGVLEFVFFEASPAGPAIVRCNDLGVDGSGTWS